MGWFCDAVVCLTGAASGTWTFAVSVLGLSALSIKGHEQTDFGGAATQAAAGASVMGTPTPAAVLHDDGVSQTVARGVGSKPPAAMLSFRYLGT